MSSILPLALGIGFVAGLRSLTAPAAVSWAAHLGWLDLHGTTLGFLASSPAVVLLFLMAVAEYVADKLPGTPSRTRPGSLIGRIVLGAFSGAALSLSARDSAAIGMVLGALGAVLGTFIGYEVRRRLVKGLGAKDVFIAVGEDLVAIGLAYVVVTGFRAWS
jgi:uncharacterized membrane protein